ncbi:MAG: UDP-N-acetylmuramoyl-L-alanine--D-glutamate ligase [Gammaproteobacteria bacterium]|nr:UDP-N-acetylmuramoyl-L-alanine--D-glutamate ligase [Gammaproteobacteria bacterium]
MTNCENMIVGLGVSGVSCAQYFSRHGIAYAVADSREGIAVPAALDKAVSVTLGEFTPEQFLACKRLIVSPGVSVKHPAIVAAQNAGAEVIGDVELFVREAKAPIVAITGSNGKSTVTTLVGEMAKQAGVKVAVGGNLGEPALNLLSDDVELYVLELSSFQLETTHSLHAAVAVVLNISPDHLDRYDSMEEYMLAKSVIYRGAKHKLVNLDDAAAMALTDSEPDLFFTLAAPAKNQYGVRDGNLCRGDEILMPVSELRLRGTHNVANVLASLALGTAVNLPLTAMRDAVREFSGLPHRMQLVTEKNRVRWINDSKATNVGATVAAINGLDGTLVLLAGGVAKENDFSAISHSLQGRSRGVVLFGRDAAQIAKDLDKSLNVLFAKDMRDAIAQARRLAVTGDTVLLAPACASFDMFKNYVERGELFTKYVNEELQHAG